MSEGNGGGHVEAPFNPYFYGPKYLPSDALSAPELSFQIGRVLQKFCVAQPFSLCVNTVALKLHTCVTGSIQSRDGRGGGIDFFMDMACFIDYQ